MKLHVVGAYFAVVVAYLGCFGLIDQLKDWHEGTATPFTFLAIFLCLGLLGMAHRLWFLRRWAVVLFTAGALMGVVSPPRSYFCLVNAIAGLIVLAYRWRDLRSGI